MCQDHKPKGLLCRSCVPSWEQAVCPQPAHITWVRVSSGLDLASCLAPPPLLRLGSGTRAQHPTGAVQRSAGFVPAVQMRPLMAALKCSQPPPITKGAWQNRSLFVCCALRSCFCKYISHEQLAPTIKRSHLCRAVLGSWSFASHQGGAQISSFPQPAAFPGRPQVWVCKASPPFLLQPSQLGLSALA